MKKYCLGEFKMEKEKNLENNKRKMRIDEFNNKIFTLEEETKVLDESERKLLDMVDQFHENNECDIRRLKEEMQFNMSGNKKMMLFLEEQMLLLRRIQHEQEVFYEEMSNEIDKARTMNEEEIEQTEREIKELS